MKYYQLEAAAAALSGKHDFVAKPQNQLGLKSHSFSKFCPLDSPSQLTEQSDGTNTWKIQASRNILAVQVENSEPQKA